MAAQTVAAAFIDGWVLAHLVIITTDQGKQFEASFFQAFSKFLSKKTKISPYHQTSD